MSSKKKGSHLRSQIVTSSSRNETLENSVDSIILFVRGQKVLLDGDLAQLYGVETKVLNQAVTRNRARFPEDFMFRLTKEEFSILKSRAVTSRNWGGRRYPPHVFTEQGVAMLSGILNSPRAIQVNIAIMRAFVKLRQLVADNEKLSSKFNAMERKYDHQFRVVFDAIRELMTPPVGEHPKIGF